MRPFEDQTSNINPYKEYISLLMIGTLRADFIEYFIPYTVYFYSKLRTSRALRASIAMSALQHAPLRDFEGPRTKKAARVGVTQAA